MVKAEFSRNLGLVSRKEQERLLDSSVSIAGAGGDGGMLAELLTRMGVGRIKLADPEVFEVENINRQACSTHSTIGTNKAEAVAAHLREINPDIEVDVYPEGITENNVESFVSDSDLLIDETEFSLHAIGTALARTAREKGIPNLMAMNIGFGATVTTFHPEGRTFEDMLGLDQNMPIDEVAKVPVSLKKWLAYIPPYADKKVFVDVAEGIKPAPSVVPGVALAASIASTQSFLSLVQKIHNRRPKPVYNPHVIAMDVMTGESRVIKYPRLASARYLLKMIVNNSLDKAPSADY